MQEGRVGGGLKRSGEEQCRFGAWFSVLIRRMLTSVILGVIGGLAVSVFSKPLALLIGLLIIGVQVGANAQDKEL